MQTTKQKFGLCLSCVAIIILIITRINSWKVNNFIEIMNDFDKVNKISVERLKREVIISRQDKIEFYKKNMQLSANIENKNKQKNMKIKISFFVDDRILCSGILYSICNNSKYILKINNAAGILKLKSNAVKEFLNVL